MASKKFDEIGGVRLKMVDSDRTRLSCSNDDADSYEIISRGDTIFEIDIENKKINRCTAKYVVKESGGMISIRYCDSNAHRDFKPTYDTFYGRHTNFKYAYVMRNKAVYGLLCTNMDDAIKRLKNINEGKYFGALKRGDKIYMVDKAKKAVVEETVERISYNNHWYNDGKHFNVETQHYRFNCYHSEYEENASRFSDSGFYIDAAGSTLDDKKVSIHMDKAVAEKVLREYLNNKKNTEKKKAAAPKIPIGTPIRHTDNKGKELHYGDLVAYVRKDHWGHTDISFGVIVGDSDKKIKVFDNEEKEELAKREKRWDDKCEDGVHVLEKANILLVRLGKQ